MWFEKNNSSFFKDLQSKTIRITSVVCRNGHCRPSNLEICRAARHQ